jgi:hypothetical protein
MLPELHGFQEITTFRFFATNLTQILRKRLLE